MTTYTLIIPDTMQLGAIHRIWGERWSVSISPAEGEYGNHFVTGYGIAPTIEEAGALAVAQLELNLANLRTIHVPVTKINLDIELDL